MDAKPLAARPSLEQYRKQAKELVKVFRSVPARKPLNSQVADSEATHAEVVQRVKKHHPRFRDVPEDRIASTRFALADAQFVIAGEHGFPSWSKFARHVDSLAQASFAAAVDRPVAAFIEAACVPRDSLHSSGTLQRAEAILAAHPEVRNSDIHTAAILGDAAAVRRFLALDRRNATAKGGPYGWDALTHLCFSRYLRLDRARSGGFVAAAKALLDAGASANTGWYEMIDHPSPRPTFESAIYGAAGIARHPELTRLLLERGADPNDEETPYHVPEGYDNTVMNILLESGRLNAVSLTTMLLRKADWHDEKGIRLLLDHGVDPNAATKFGANAFHHAMRRDNSLRIIEELLDHRADPALPNARDGRSATATAARRGRGDVLTLLKQRGLTLDLHGVDRLIAACAQ